MAAVVAWEWQQEQEQEQQQERTSTKELLALLGNRLPCTFLAWPQGKRLITWHTKRLYKKSSRTVYLVRNRSQNRIQWVFRGGGHSHCGVRRTQKAADKGRT